MTSTTTAAHAQPLAWMRALDLQAKAVPPRQLLVLHRLALAMAADGSGEVAVTQLAAAVGVSDDTVGRAIAWACSAGLLQRVSRGHRVTDGLAPASTYQLLQAGGEPR